MNSRVLNIILPIIALVIYICIDFVYVFLAKDRYAAVIRNIQKEEMEIDAVAAIVCYICERSFFCYRPFIIHCFF